MGILKPILISSKVLFQNLCNKKFEWYECISDEFKSEWNDVLSYFGNVWTIGIPRIVLNRHEGHPPQKADLHGFSDSSQQNYGAYIYLKSIFNGGKISVHQDLS